MKVFISADMEGVAGVVHEEQTFPGNPEYERARRLLTHEVNAAIEGALKAGATEVVVNDSHYYMRNILPEELHTDARLVSGWPKPMSQMEGIDGTFKAAIFIGYHSKRGTSRGVLEHSYNGKIVDEIKLNGRSVGEMGINAAIAGYFGVPVVLVSGDLAVTREASALIEGVGTVTVKEAVGRLSAISLHPKKAIELIKAASIASLQRAHEIRPVKIASPVRLELEFANCGMADMAEMIPDVRRAAPKMMLYETDDLLKAYKMLRAMIALAGIIL